MGTARAICCHKRRDRGPGGSCPTNWLQTGGRDDRPTAERVAWVFSAARDAIVKAARRPNAKGNRGAADRQDEGGGQREITQHRRPLRVYQCFRRLLTGRPDAGGTGNLADALAGYSKRGCQYLDAKHCPPHWGKLPGRYGIARQSATPGVAVRGTSRRDESGCIRSPGASHRTAAEIDRYVNISQWKLASIAYGSTDVVTVEVRFLYSIREHNQVCPIYP